MLSIIDFITPDPTEKETSSVALDNKETINWKELIPVREISIQYHNMFQKLPEPIEGSWEEGVGHIPTCKNFLVLKLQTIYTIHSVLLLPAKMPVLIEQLETKNILTMIIINAVHTQRASADEFAKEERAISLLFWSHNAQCSETWRFVPISQIR